MEQVERQVETELTCENCKEWGRTVTREDCFHPVPCPRCKRLTWPNLGVNLPAGCAVALGTGNAIWILKALEQIMEQPEYGYINFPMRLSKKELPMGRFRNCWNPHDDANPPGNYPMQSECLDCGEVMPTTEIPNHKCKGGSSTLVDDKTSLERVPAKLEEMERKEKKDDGSTTKGGDVE